MPPRRRVRLADRQAVERAATSLAGLFAAAEQTIRERTAEQVAAGFAADPDDALRLVRLPELRAQAATIVRDLQRATDAEVGRIIDAARAGGHAALLRELSGASGVDLAAVSDVLPNAPAAQAVALELAGAVTGAARGILRWPDDVYRQAVGQQSALQLLGARRTSREAQAAALQRLLAQGVTGFTDTLGRRWNAATYVEMATRTAARRAWDAQHQETARRAGVELVTAIVGNDACRTCAQHAGRVLRLDPGPVGRLTLPSAYDADATVTVDVDGTLVEAQAENGSHFQGPNCRCRIVAYLPGGVVPADATSYDPDLEAQRDHLRYLERQVRKAKVAHAAAVTPEQQRDATARVREYQARIREHVEATGLVRKRYREQVNLGLRA